MSDQLSNHASSSFRDSLTRWFSDSGQKKSSGSDNQKGSGDGDGSGGKPGGPNGVRPSRGLFTVVTAIMLGAMVFLIITTIPQAKPVESWNNFETDYTNHVLKNVEIRDDGVYAIKTGTDGVEQQVYFKFGSAQAAT